MDTVYFSSALGKRIEFTDERRRHILQYHPDLAPFLDRLGEVLIGPNEIRKTSEDPEVLLFYKFYSDILRGKYIVVVVKVNDRSFILTAYLARRVKTGESL